MAKISEEMQELIEILGEEQAKELVANTDDEKLFERIRGFLDIHWENIHSAIDELEKEAKIINALIIESRRFSSIEQLLKAMI